MGVTILSDLGTEILIPVCALIGIGFALVQWVIVSKVTVSVDSKSSSSGADGKNGYAESLIEEEEGINDHSVVHRCAEIQNAISEGTQNSLIFVLSFQFFPCIEIVCMLNEIITYVREKSNIDMITCVFLFFIM